VECKKPVEDPFDFTPDARGNVQSARLLDTLRSRVSLGDTDGSMAGFRPLRQDDPRRTRVQNVIFGETPPADATLAEQRAIGSVLGMILGDAIGAAVEFQPVAYGRTSVTGMGEGRQGAFKLLPGQWTDDASMGLCIADSLIKTYPDFQPADLMLRFVAWWFCGYNNAFAHDQSRGKQTSVGLGGNISQSFADFLRRGQAYTPAGDKNTSGNGSIMRLAPAPVAFHDDVAMARKVSGLQSLTTHQGTEASGCCELLAQVICTGIHAAEGATPPTVLDEAMAGFSLPGCPSVEALSRAEQEGTDPDRDWRWRRPDHRYSPSRSAQQPGYVGSYAMDNAAMALHCVFTTTSFQEAVLKAANMRGDADSVASVAGQLAGAIYGVRAIPQEWIRTMQRWDGGGDVALRASLLFHHEKA